MHAHIDKNNLNDLGLWWLSRPSDCLPPLRSCVIGAMYRTAYLTWEEFINTLFSPGSPVPSHRKKQQGELRLIVELIIKIMRKIWKYE